VRVPSYFVSFCTGWFFFSSKVMHLFPCLQIMLPAPPCQTCPSQSARTAEWIWVHSFQPKTACLPHHSQTSQLSPQACSLWTCVPPASRVQTYLNWAEQYKLNLQTIFFLITSHSVLRLQLVLQQHIEYLCYCLTKSYWHSFYHWTSLFLC
jgi:hypothetical protein